MERLLRRVWSGPSEIRAGDRPESLAGDSTKDPAAMMISPRIRISRSFALGVAALAIAPGLA
ncbi:MAG TPA: hypothetical protein VFT74_05670, partial [Isosphaeraceae bacterium]|nr:hypothetical protein [Isosphaeraceae bacterium]